MNETYFEKHLHFPSTPLSVEDATVTVDTYRITILRERLFRIEYSALSKFEDRPTQTFWHRHLTVPFQKDITGSIITINTSYWTITIDTAKEGLSGLSITSIENSVTYTYGTQDSRNLKGTYRTLDMVDGECELEPGLLSKNGITVYDDSSSVVFSKGQIVDVNSDDIDLYVFGYGLDYEQCIKDFYLISGKTPLIPKYVFGNWWSRYWNYNADDVKDVVHQFESRDIPLSVYIIDMDWHITDVPQELRGGWTGYTWNKELFPNPDELMSWLKDHQLKISMNLHPADGIRPFDDCYDAVCKRMGKDPSDKEIIDFDLTNPLFVEAYFKDIHHQLEKQGVDFWWIDWQQGTESKMKNLDPLFALNHYHFIDGLNRGKHHYFIFSRWSKLGSHRYPIGFSGDTFTTWKSLDFQPYFTSTATNVGYGWWSHDIGGHQQGIQSGELYTRWVQYGVFSPVMRLHSTKTLYSRREPWRYNMEVEFTVKQYLRFRHKLIPYIHTFNHLHASGELPLIQPLYYSWPEQDNSYKFKNQYFFGSELMVRPFTSKTIKKLNLAKEKVWFPTGDWFHFFTGEHIRNAGIYTFYGSTRDINLFAKAGAIIPLASKHQQGQDDIPQEMTINVFPKGSNTFTLIEDHSGVIYNTTFTLQWSENSQTIHISSDKSFEFQRLYHIVFRSIDNQTITECETSHSISTDESTNSLTVSFSSSLDTSVTVSLSNQKSILKQPYNLEQDIMNSIDRSDLDTPIKNEIGYIDYRKPQESRGWIAEQVPLNNKLNQIKDLNVPKYVKKYLYHTVLRAIKNDE